MSLCRVERRWNAEAIFLAVGLSPALAARVAGILRCMGWAAPGDFVYDALGRWMRGQQSGSAAGLGWLHVRCL